VLLHSVAQKKLHGIAAALFEEELIRAQDCLQVLEYCGECDPVASTFSKVMLDLHSSVVKERPGAPSADSIRYQGLQYTGANANVPRSSTFLLQIPPGQGVNSESLSMSLLTMLCKPFGNPENQQGALDSMHAGWKSDPSRWEYAQMVERLDCHFESSLIQQSSANYASIGLADVKVKIDQPPRLP
jgi:hypothetical protein